MAFLDNLAIVACVIIDYHSLVTIFEKVSIERLGFPYVSTLLSFREGPPMINLIKSIEFRPDIFLINSQGIAHPMLCGCASHVGVLANAPTIGVAAQKLCGEYDHQPEKVGDYVPLNFDGKPVGWVLKSKEKCRQIYVSPGHLVSLNSSIDIVVECVKNHKLPEPLYLAHTLANEKKRKMAQTH